MNRARPPVETGTARRSSLASLLAPAVAVLLVLAALAGWSIQQEFRNQRAQAGARLESIAELRATQVQAWLDRHMSFAQFIDDSPALAALYTRWRDSGDAAAGRTLLDRAIDMRHADGDDSALIFDAAGEVIAREHPSRLPTSPELKAAIAEAVRSGAPVDSSVYRQADSEMPLRLDVVIPFLATGHPPRGGMVLRIDPRRSLFPLLAAWPVPSDTGEIVLWDRVGGRVLNISDVRRQADSVGRIDEPVAGSTLPVARAMRGELPAGVATEAVDYWHARVLTVARPVPGTDWWLVAKIDLDEVDAPAWAHARITLVAAVLALLGVALATRLWAQRRDLVHAQADRLRQRERLQALALLEAIARSASDAIYAKNLDGEFVFCNQAAADILGRSIEDIVGHTNEDVFGAGLGARITADDRRATSGETGSSFEETLSTARGDVQVLSTKGPLVDADGRLIGMLGVSRDVSAVRRSERALRGSEEHYRTVVAVLKEGILVCDIHGIVTSCNPAAERMTGATSAQWQGQPIIAPGWSLVHADGSPMPLEDLSIARVLAGGPAEHDVPIQTLSPSGEMIFFQLSSVPVVDPDSGHLTSVVTSFVDVTASRRLEADLLRHRDELEALVEERTHELLRANESIAATARFNRDITDAIPGLVTYWDHDLRCRFANQTYLDEFGKTAGEVLGRTRAEIFGRRYAGPLADRLALALGGSLQRFDFTPEPPGPRGPRVYQVHYTPALGSDDAIVGVYMMAFDISALKTAEAELTVTIDALARSRDDADIANRAKSAFVANMSHEIRTPLNGILGLAYLLARDPRDALQRERLGKIGDAGQHLLQIINDILDLSKIEADKLTLEEIDFSLDTLLAAACDMVAERARAKNLEIVLDIDRVPRQLCGDPTRLSQVVLNLLSNAVKFTASGWIRLRADLLEERDARLHVRFEVQDTGEGIPLDRQAGLFNAFEQGDNTTTRRFGGTGLGLSLTRRLAHAMRGEVGVVSAPGEGSTFWFTAWLRHGRQGADAPAPEPMKSLRILLVDDLQEASTVIAGHLMAMGMGMHVDVCDSGEAALRKVEFEMAHGRPYDLMLIDSSIRGRDGVPALVRLHELMGEGMPPCVLMSSSNDATLRQQSRGVPFEAVLDKPAGASALHDVVARVLYRQGGAAPVTLAVPADAIEERLRERHHGQRVLLAEDNIINRLVARELLSGVGLVVEQAENGAVALDLALAQSYDLVLMDMQMPVMDGLEASRSLRERGHLSVPIIAMTANAFAEDREACLAAGMNDHISKPVDPATLYRMLLRWLPRQAPDATARETMDSSGPGDSR